MSNKSEEKRSKGDKLTKYLLLGFITFAASVVLTIIFSAIMGSGMESGNKMLTEIGNTGEGLFVCVDLVSGVYTIVILIMKVMHEFEIELL